jgi:hypothetical protein
MNLGGLVMAEVIESRSSSTAASTAEVVRDALQ